MKKIIFAVCLGLGALNSASAATFKYDDNGPKGSNQTKGGITVMLTAPLDDQTRAWVGGINSNNRGVGVQTDGQTSIGLDMITGGETLRVNFDTTVTVGGVEFSNWGPLDAVKVTASNGNFAFLNDNVVGNKTFGLGMLGSLTFFDITHTNGAGSALHQINNVNVSAVPVPAAAWLFGSGILGLVGISRRKKAASALAA